jgi:hypothetical protein
MLPTLRYGSTLLSRFKGQSGFRPLNFMLAVQLMGEVSNGSQAKLCLVTPFTKNRSAWKTAIYRDVASGEEYTLYDEDAPCKPSQVDAICYGGIIEQHRFHPEPKFCGADGQPCGRNTRGLLEQRHVQIGRKIPIRKESNRRWEGGNDPSILQDHELDRPDSTATEYVRTDGLVAPRFDLVVHLAERPQASTTGAADDRAAPILKKVAEWTNAHRPRGSR